MKTEFKIIETKKEYESAISKFEKVFHAKAGTKEAKEAKLLALIIEDYENKHIPIPEPDPIEAIKFMMEQSNMSQSDLTVILGNKGNVSKVLNKKRKLSLEMIRNISKSLHIPADILIKDYSLLI
jgi:HTH-type transcriptional regulator / antitoxin HigA